MRKRHLYPENWEEISLQVRERAGQRCETCNAPNGEEGAHHPQTGEWHARSQWIAWTEAGTGGGQTPDDELPRWWPKNLPRVILTAAHQDHAAGLCRCEAINGRKCGNLEHLRALCQRCHLALDLPKHLSNAAATRRRKELERQPELCF